METNEDILMSCRISPTILLFSQIMICISKIIRFYLIHTIILELDLVSKNILRFDPPHFISRYDFDLIITWKLSFPHHSNYLCNAGNHYHISTFGGSFATNSSWRCNNTSSSKKDLPNKSTSMNNQVLQSSKSHVFCCRSSICYYYYSYNHGLMRIGHIKSPFARYWNFFDRDIKEVCKHMLLCGFREDFLK